MFGNEEIYEALKLEKFGVGDQVAISLFDAESEIGVGRTSSGAFVLLLPSQPGVDPIEGRHLEFRPWVTVEVWTGDVIADAALVICEYSDATDFEIAALALIFEALMNQAVHSKDVSAAGRTVHSLFLLFENRLATNIPSETEIGLLGELLVIASSSDPRSLLDSWHIDPSDRYDFSLESERLEVKNTLGSERVHHFSSTQLPPAPGLQLGVVSIRCDRVAKGTGIADLYLEIVESIADNQATENFRGKCIEVLGADPQMIRGISIDRIRAVESIRLLDAGLIPTPTFVDGVRSINWVAEISDEVAPSLSSQLAMWAGLNG